MSMLEELYYGNIHPAEKHIKKGGEYQKLNQQLMDTLDELMTMLNDEEKQLYEKAEDMAFNLKSISEKEYFIEGFCMGAQIMREIACFKSTNYV